MGVEESNGQPFRSKKIRELVAQAANTFPLNDRLKGEVNELRKLVSEAETTGDWANLEAKIDQLNQAYEKVKPTLSLINFISWKIEGMKDLLRQVLCPDFDIALAENTVARLFSDSRSAFDNSKKVDLIRLAGTVAKIKDFLTQSPYENSVLEKVKEEVLNLREILTQIVKQIYTIEEKEDFLVKELERNGQQNQNTNEPENPQITNLNTELEKLKKIKAEMQNIIGLVHNYLEEIIQILNSNTPEDVRIWQEYIEELRRWRLNHEEEIRSQFNQFLEQHPLDPDLERIRIAELRRLIVDPDDPEALDHLRQNFPSGNFVYHGTKFGRVIEILTSGYLKNVKALKETHGENVPNNAGYEGISWSLNNIKALPGDRFHLAGFLGSPEKILDPNQKFTIPSRPAPFELVQINRDIEPNEFYDFNIQNRIYRHVSLGDSNSVASNLVKVANFENKNTSKSDSIPMLIKFLNEHLDDQKLARELRKFYQIRTKDGQLKRFQEKGENFNNSDSTVRLSEALLQQNEIPVAAVWIQALIDTGRINNDLDFQGLTTVRAIVQRMPGKKNPLKEEFFKEIAYLNRLWEEQERKITPIQVPVSKLYLVVPKHDLEKYLRILARCEPSTWPKGIIVYDNRQIRLENFISLHTGDHATLTQWLQNLIPPGTPAEGYIDYCSTFLGKPKISPKDRTGYRNNAIKDSIIHERPSIIVNNGRLIIRQGKNRAST